MKKNAKRQRRPNERPDEIAHAALSVICKRGYHESTMDDIAEAAGVTKGAVYHHFKSKEDLLLVAMRGYFRSVMSQLSDSVEAAQGLSPRQRVRSILETGTALWLDTKFRAVFTIAFGEVGNAVPRVRKAFLAMGPLQAWPVLAAAILQGQQEGQFRGDLPAEFLARQIASSLALQCLLLAPDGSRAAARQNASQEAIELSLTLLSLPTSILRRGQTGGKCTVIQSQS